MFFLGGWGRLSWAFKVLSEGPSRSLLRIFLQVYSIPVAMYLTFGHQKHGSGADLDSPRNPESDSVISDPGNIGVLLNIPGFKSTLLSSLGLQMR
jgi:hypothetical protein